MKICGIIQQTEVFIPKDDGVKIQIIKLKNETPRRRKIKVIYYLKPVLGEDELKTNGLINMKFNKNNNFVCANNISSTEFNNYIFVSSSEKIKSYTGIKKDFLGEEGLQNPRALKLENLSNYLNYKLNEIIAIEFEIELEALDSKEFSIILGAGDSYLECQDLAYKYRNIQNCYNELEQIKKYWEKILNKIHIETPDKSFNLLLNGWAIYQTLESRIVGKTGFYQSGGAYGFRDQLQDCLAIKYFMPEKMREQIIKHSQHQFIEGDVEHWWHDETNRGIRTRFSDDLLWLPYCVCDYIEFTNDYSILNIESNYIDGEVLPDNIDEKYDVFLPSDKKENIYNHCVRAIEKSLNFGKNGLPKIGSGDWNDGFNTVGNKGEGESVWLAFFLCDVLNKFIPICEYMGDDSQKYKLIIEQLKKSININAWDGRWYKRAFMDDGKELGSIQNDECKIDSIAQSWSIISGVGDNDKKYISMESLENHLVDKENGIIKLLDPPFEKGNLEPGYIKNYLPGTRENGGQYTHAAAWAIIAEAILGFGDKAVQLFNMINPIEHTKNKEGVLKYKVEPYVIAADIYGQNSLTGRGGWTWYTGSSSWLYIAGIKYILGLKIENGFMSFEPHISCSWAEYSIRYNYGDAVYNIKVKNPYHKSSGVESVKLNGNLIENKKIKLDYASGINEIEVLME